jgi:hypothetical protein
VRKHGAADQVAPRQSYRDLCRPPDGLSASLNVAVVKLPGVQACGPDQTRDDGTDDALTAFKGFTLAEQSAPVGGISWIDFCDPELTLASVGLIWNGARFEGSLNRVPTRVVDEEVLDWVERYLHLSPDMCDVVDVAIGRLNMARRRTSLGDKAIDGAICLESLLGDDASQELSYRLKLRAALLLGKTVEERKAEQGRTWTRDGGKEQQRRRCYDCKRSRDLRACVASGRQNEPQAGSVGVGALRRR